MGNAMSNNPSVAETFLITPYIRAMESQRPDALIKVERAEALVRQLDQETLHKTLALTEDSGRLVMILKSREFDRFAQDYMARHHFLACSVFDRAWLDAVSVHHPRPFLFLAEGLFMYFQEAQVKSLVLTLEEHFPGAELVFDAYSPFMRWAHNNRVNRTRIGVHLHWALEHAQDLEQWSEPSTSLGAGGIRLLDERYPFQFREPRLRRNWRVRLVPLVARGIGVFRYQL
jgi:O-methyltransferase involved in polyketide biosynthesis